MKLEIENLEFSYNRCRVLDNISLTMEPKVNALIGPNGAGKSTLIKCLAGILRPKGDMLFDGKKITASYKDYFRSVMSYLPQTSPESTALTVFEVVLLGLLNSLSFRISDEEADKVVEVLKLLEIEDIAHRQFNELSGGQKQMVSIAQAIIKEPKLLLLDEPLNSLDIHHQFEFLNLIRHITWEKNIITLIAFHDLNLAARYADNIVVLSNGAIFDSGEPKKVLTQQSIRSVYKVDARIFTEEGGYPVIYPVSPVMP